MALGGVEIPSNTGLQGHSDADVILHALMDALLGAAGLGDVGQHFPPTDEQFRGISSLVLLARVRDLVEQSGYSVVNADVMVVAEEPLLSGHVAAMRLAISRALRVDAARISIKATTNEGVGPEGRREAISAQAVALVES